MHTPQVSNSAGHEVQLRHARGLNRKEVRQLVMIGRERTRGTRCRSYSTNRCAILGARLQLAMVRRPRCRLGVASLFVTHDQM